MTSNGPLSLNFSDGAFSFRAIGPQLVIVKLVNYLEHLSRLLELLLVPRQLVDLYLPLCLVATHIVVHGSAGRQDLVSKKEGADTFGFFQLCVPHVDMLVEGARGDQIELGNERDTVDSIVVGLPWTHLPDIILLVLDLLERLAKGHTGQRESCILGTALRRATFLRCIRNAMPLLLLPRLENSFVPFEFVEQD